MADYAEIFVDALRAAVLITGMVVMMMMMIESLNISSEGRFFKRLQGSRFGQIVVSALLGWIPGCMGGFASVSLFSHGMISFGALVAMLIATSGDEAFVMLTLFPGKALWISLLILVIGILAGVLVDYLGPKLGFKPYALKSCSEMQVHDEDTHQAQEPATHQKKRTLFTWKRIVLFIGIGLYIAALASGMLEHEHEEGAEVLEAAETAHDGHGFNLLSEDWMNMLFAAVSLVMLAVAALGSDHFVEEHLWHHIIARHVPKIFAWTFGVLIALGFIMEWVDVSHWISANVPLMILLATLIGIIPESGPHLIFVTLFAAGVVPAPVLIASCISQDGHASLPLLAESKGAFLRAKAINCLIALVVGFIAYLL
ncbi:MAG: putative manganese transporter [Bacteroidales bacterium]|nr:putative manganese transporter [Bacteroidales bacterium]